MSARLAIVTTGRQDYGILRSTIHALREAPDFVPLVWAGGMHLSPRFGHTVDMVRADGVHVDRELPFLEDPPSPVGDTAAALRMVGELLLADAPDAIILAGDRTETLAAGLAATIARVPIVHLHGGEETAGAIDNVCRHALTKLSHLHLVSHVAYARRVIDMGEATEQVVVVGPPGVDNLYRDDLPGRKTLFQSLGIDDLPDPVVVATVHPATLGSEPLAEIRAVCHALETVECSVVATLPNADQGGVEIAEFLHRWARGRPRVVVSSALGEHRYWGLLRIAAAIIGNSSSGLVEAPAAGVPVVNVGDRQEGRLRLGAVIDVPAIPAAVARALRDALAGRISVSAGQGFPAGPAAPRIMAALRAWDIPRPPRKPSPSTVA